VKRVMVAASAALILAIGAAASATAEDSDVFCGTEGAHYRCGGILVILEEETSDSMADVIERLGGDPETDILQEFRGVRDLLDPDGVADDLSEAIVYSIAVPVGQEEAMAATYAADPAVYAAAVDRETIGYIHTPPDTAMAPPTSNWLPLVGALLIVLAGGLAVMRGRAASSGANLAVITNRPGAESAMVGRRASRPVRVGGACGSVAASPRPASAPRSVAGGGALRRTRTGSWSPRSGRRWQG